MQSKLIRQRLAAQPPKWRHLVAANIVPGGNPFSEGSNGDVQVCLVCCASARR